MERQATLLRTPGVEGWLLAAAPAGVPGRLQHLIGEVTRGDAEPFFYQHHRVDPGDQTDTVTPEVRGHNAASVGYFGRHVVIRFDQSARVIKERC